jgi:hypothetical protein
MSHTLIVDDKSNIDIPTSEPLDTDQAALFILGFLRKGFRVELHDGNNRVFRIELRHGDVRLRRDTANRVEYLKPGELFNFLDKYAMEIHILV